MRGGMRMPPNDDPPHGAEPVGEASMRGGMRMPPNLTVSTQEEDAMPLQ